MQYNQKIISDYFKKVNNQFMFWGEDDYIALDEEYFAMDYLSLFVSLSGTIEISTDVHRWVAGNNDLQFFAYEKLLYIKNASRDYKSVGILFSRRSWAEKVLHNFPSLSLALISPVIKISNSRKDILLDFMNQIRIYKQEGRADDNPLMMNTVMGLLGQAELACQESLMDNHFNPSVVKSFGRLLASNYKEHREVEFYADQLNLSPSHFSALIKQSTGKTVGSCIKQYVALKACSELKNSEKSVKEIALNMNFADVSYFCKFFRKNVGLSPEEFRHGKVTRKA